MSSSAVPMSPLYPPTPKPLSFHSVANHLGVPSHSVWVISPFHDPASVSLLKVLSLTSSSSSTHVPNRSPTIPQLSMSCPIKLNSRLSNTSNNRLTNRGQDQGQGQSPSSCHGCPLWAQVATSGSCRALCFSPRSWNFHPDSSFLTTHSGSQRSQGEEVRAVMPYVCTEMTLPCFSCAMEDSESFHFLNKIIQTNFCLWLQGHKAQEAGSKQNHVCPMPRPLPKGTLMVGSKFISQGKS